MYGALLARVRKRSWRFQEADEYGIVKEFNCRVTSTWSNCGREKETAFTHQQFGKKEKKELHKTRLASTTMSKCGTLGTTTRITL